MSLLDLLVKKEGLIGDAMAGGHLRHSYQMTALHPWGRKQVSQQNCYFAFLESRFGAVRDLANRVPWKIILKGRGVQEGWILFRTDILKAQDQTIPMCQQRRWAIWMNRESFFWNSRKKDKIVYNLCKKEKASQENYEDVVKLCNEKIWRTIAQLELNLATVVKDNKHVFINT